MSCVIALLLLPLLLWPEEAESHNHKKERLEQMDLVVNITSAPYVVVVFCEHNKSFCTGTLVDAQWVLTSAHCLFDLEGVNTEDQHSVTVLAGLTNITDYFLHKDPSGVVQRGKSVNVTIHKNFSWSENFIYDVALIQMKEPFKMTAYVNVAPLHGKILQTSLSDLPAEATSGGKAGEMECDGYGFGKLERHSDHPVDKTLKFQRYAVGNKCKCLERIRSVRQPYNILKKKNIFLCDSMSSQTGLCRGDNGGPLVCDGFVRGIASTVVDYRDKSQCRLRVSGDRNECGSEYSLNVFTDLCLVNRFLRSVVPSFPHLNRECKLVRPVLHSKTMDWDDY